MNTLNYLLNSAVLLDCSILNDTLDNDATWILADNRELYISRKITPETMHWLFNNAPIPDKQQLFEIWNFWQPSEISDIVSQIIRLQFGQGELVLMELKHTRKLGQFTNDYIVLSQDSFWDMILNHVDVDALISIFETMSFEFPYIAEIDRILLKSCNLETNECDINILKLSFIISCRYEIETLRKKNDANNATCLLESLIEENDYHNIFINLLRSAIKYECNPNSFLWINIRTLNIIPLNQLLDYWIECAASYMITKDISIDLSIFSLEATHSSTIYKIDNINSLRGHLMISIYQKLIFDYPTMSFNELRSRLVSHHMFLSEEEFLIWCDHDSYITSQFFDVFTYWIYDGKRKQMDKNIDYKEIFKLINAEYIYIYWVKHCAPLRFHAFIQGIDVEWEKLNFYIDSSILCDTCLSLLNPKTGFLLYKYQLHCDNHNISQGWLYLVIHDVLMVTSHHMGQDIQSRYIFSNLDQSSINEYFKDYLDGIVSAKLKSLLNSFISLDVPRYAYINKDLIRSLYLIRSTFEIRSWLKAYSNMNPNEWDSEILYPALDFAVMKIFTPSVKNLNRHYSMDKFVLHDVLNQFHDDIKSIEIIVKQDCVKRTEVSFAIHQNMNQEEFESRRRDIFDNTILFDYYTSFVQSLTRHYEGCVVKTSGHVRGKSGNLNMDCLQYIPDIFGIKTAVLIAVAPAVVLLKLQSLRHANNFIQLVNSSSEMSKLADTAALYLLNEQRKRQHIQRVLSKPQHSVYESIREHARQWIHDPYNSVVKSIATNDVKLLIEYINQGNIKPEIIEDCKRKNPDCLAILLSSTVLQLTSLIEDDNIYIEFFKDSKGLMKTIDKVF